MDDEKKGRRARGKKEEKYQDRRVTLNKHWVRPRFLQYDYMYDYRLNYYDDVIDYLDKKQNGVKADLPKPQTWAERVLRTMKDKPHASCYNYDDERQKRDPQLKITITNQINSYNYHSKGYTNRKYASIL